MIIYTLFFLVNSTYELFFLGIMNYVFFYVMNYVSKLNTRKKMFFYGKNCKLIDK